MGLGGRGISGKWMVLSRGSRLRAAASAACDAELCGLWLDSWCGLVGSFGDWRAVGSVSSDSRA